jgi:hypothetical protein
VADTITLTFKVAQDGSLKAIGQDAEKTAKQTDKATKSSNRYNKGAKGVGQAGLSASKGFSKMRAEIGGGSGGLVGAYAGLAANVFALTALFGALSRASRATQLEEGLLSLGQASGLAMHTLAKGLVDATDGAISLEEAMRSTAVITSAGIDPGSIERFGKVARGAALALGRDTQDAISRLTRGITKLEPELLDELGIMVRLDEASKNYADTIGKNVSDLSRYEKSQAFLNATLEEGERKFGALADVDVNVYDQLAAGLQNLAKSGIGSLADLISPIVGYLASSPTALLGVLALFASTISGAVMGSLADMAEKLAANTAATIDFSVATIEQATGLNSSSKTLKRYARTLQEGGDVLGEYRKASDGQAQSIQTANDWKDAGSISQEQLNQKLQNAKIITEDLSLATQQHALAQVQDASASALLKFAQGDLSGGFKDTWKVLKGVGLTMKTSIITTTSLKTAFSGLGVSARAAGVGLKTLGAGFMALLGPLGMAFSIGSMLLDMLKGLVNSFRSKASIEYSESIDKMNETLDELKGNLKEVDEGFSGNSVKIYGAMASYIALNNVLSQFNSKFAEMASLAATTNNFGPLIDVQEALINNSVDLSRRFAQFKKDNPDGYGLFVSAEKEAKATTRFLATVTNMTGQIKALDGASKGAKDAITSFINSAKVKTDVDEVLGAITALTSNILKENDKKVLEVNPELKVDDNFSELLNKAITGDMAVVYGLTKQKNELNKQDTKRLALVKATSTGEAKLLELSGYIGEYEGVSKSLYLEKYKIKLAEVEAQRVALATAKKESSAAADAVAFALEAEKVRLKLIRTQRIESKLIEGVKKAELSLAKEQEVNTKSTLQARQKAQNSLLDTQISQNQAAQEEKTIQFNRVAVLGKFEELTLSNQNLYLKYQAEGNQLLADGNVLVEKKLDSQEIELELQKMYLNALKENQKVEKALLSLGKKGLKADETKLSTQLKLAQLTQARDNRKTGADDTASQRLAIELDQKVVMQKVSFIAREAMLKKKTLKMERKLQEFKLRVLLAEAQNINKTREVGDKIPIGPLQEMIKELSPTGEGGAFATQMENITLNAQLQAEELAKQLATTNLVAIEASERLKREEQVNALIREESKIRQDIVAKAIQMETVANSISKANNTDLFGNPKSIAKAAKLVKEAEQLKVKVARAVAAQALIAHNLEMQVLDAKFELMKAEAEADGRISTQEAKMLNAQQDVINAQMAASEQSVKAARQAASLAESQANLANKQQLGSAAEQGFGAVVKTMVGQYQAEIDKKTEDSSSSAKRVEEFSAGVLKGFDESTVASRTNQLLEEILKKMGGELPVVAAAGAPAAPTLGADGQPVAENIINSSLSKEGSAVPGILGTGGEADEGPLVKAVTNTDRLRASLQGAANDMAALGPEGAGPSAMLGGLATMGGAFEENITGSERAAAAIAGIGQIMQGAAQQKIAALDSEIEAEKKRDGKSASSIAKIAAMEKKKEQTKRKAFNTNKKMMMAETVMNTATAVMQSFKNAGGYPLGMGMAVAMGAIGAAQLAVISSMSYQGGGGGGGVSAAPASVSMGERSNTVDLAKGNNSAGELAYMRGESGVGTGATNFKPKGAFSGYKHRGAGGYVVGEQGPELFMPETPGEIIPSGKGGGAPTNVNFNISAVDASGVEDVLMRQKGHIISMIREAANEHGQPFLEGINTDVYSHTNTNEVK